MRLSVLHEGLPDDAVSVPIVKQKTDHSCGPAVVTSVLKYFKLFDGSEKDLYEKLDTKHDTGTQHTAIVKVLKDYGLIARYKTNVDLDELKNWVSATKVAIIELQAYGGDHPDKTTRWGHYVVLVGFDDDKAYFMDPMMSGHKYGQIPLAEFPGRWHGLGSDDETRVNHQVIFISGKSPMKNGSEESDVGKIR